MEVVGIVMGVYNIGCGIYIVYKNTDIIMSYFQEKENYRIIARNSHIYNSGKGELDLLLGEFEAPILENQETINKIKLESEKYPLISSFNSRDSLDRDQNFHSLDSEFESSLESNLESNLVNNLTLSEIKIKRD